MTRDKFARQDRMQINDGFYRAAAFSKMSILWDAAVAKTSSFLEKSTKKAPGFRSGAFL